jgi:hypothetical protein
MVAAWAQCAMDEGRRGDSWDETLPRCCEECGRCHIVCVCDECMGLLSVFNDFDQQVVGRLPVERVSRQLRKKEST